MKFCLLHVCTLLFVSLLGSHAHAVTPEVYWKSVLPNTPMPKSLKDILQTELNDEKTTVAGGDRVHEEGVWKGGVHVQDVFLYDGTKNPLKDDLKVTLVFLPNDLHQGKEMNLQFIKKDKKTKFLPRQIADTIPFSSNKLPEIYNKFAVKPKSMEAELMKQTLNECETKGIQGEEKYCVTSLESMVDFSTTKLGNNLKAISTEVIRSKESTPLQKYQITAAKKFAGNKVVVCHKQDYPYAIYYCHYIVNTQAYVVFMTGVDGTRVNVVAACHTDTANWNPKHLAFQVLKVKPGTVPICHFLPEENVVWVPY